MRVGKFKKSRKSRNVTINYYGPRWPKMEKQEESRVPNRRHEQLRLLVMLLSAATTLAAALRQLVASFPPLPF
jgi:hypothetical protein